MLYHAIVAYAYGGQYCLPEFSQADTTGKNRRQLSARMKRLCRHLLYTDYPVDLQIRNRYDELVERWTQEKQDGPWKNTY